MGPNKKKNRAVNRANDNNHHHYTSNLTIMIQQQHLSSSNHSYLVAVQQQDDIMTGPSNAVIADEDLITENSILLGNSSRHSNNYGNKTTSAMEDNDYWFPFRGNWNTLSSRIAVFPHTHHHHNNEDEFGRYKYISMVMFFIRERMVKDNLDEEEPERLKMVVYTTISAYALTTVLTGIGLLLFVVFKYNFFLEFFPRHIYIGAFGGIGCYLIKTAINFSIQLSEKSFDLEGLKKNFSHENNFLSWESLIENGWIFDLDDQITMSEFYSDFRNWEAIIKTTPIMITLAYFTILSVNVNISKLEASLYDHQINTDRELIVQGVSNLIAGPFQASLEHEESVLLIKSRVNNRVVGLILAFCIGITVYFGQILLFIQYIPTITVGTVIFYLGMEMVREALVDSWKIFNKLECLNVIATMVAMTFIGFVKGIFIGIAISYIYFMILNYQRGAVRSTFSGNSVRSSVRRHYRDQKFLEKLGSQIYVMMLQGYMFYGSMKGVENVIKKILIDREQKAKPIRFLILNMLHVTGLDVNSVHVLESIQKHLQHRKIYLVICEMSYESQQVYIPFTKLSFWKDARNDHVKFCGKSNDALEWCENSLLGAYYAKHRSLFSNNRLVGVQHQAIPSLVNDESPCNHQVEDAGRSVFGNELCLESENELVNTLMKVFKEITNEKEEFFDFIASYFTKEELQRDSQLWSQGDDPNCIYVVEEGQLSTYISVENNEPIVMERILPLTMIGELGFLTKNQRPTNLVTNTPCVLWQMDHAAYLRMMEHDYNLGADFIKLAVKYSVERLRNLNHYAFD
ncbi:12414_t:CDS:10 [Entrophospora sp. SA101]|nr:12414_t:CDS:10 [Entrophospora sp. SA101]